jgi:hypothetical protein
MSRAIVAPPAAAPPPRDVGYALRPWIVCGLPAQRPEAAEWSRRNGPVEMRIVAGEGQAVPHGQDRVLLLLVATAVVRQNRRHVDLGSAYSLLAAMGLPPSGRNYERLQARLRRVFASSTFFTFRARRDGVVAVQRRAFLFFAEPRLWSPAAAPGERTIRVTVSEGFWNELRRALMPIDLTVVRALAGSPVNLHFYLWLALRAHGVRPGNFADVPLFGKLGLVHQLGAGHYPQERDFRRHVRRWIDRTREAWPECPCVIKEDGRHLVIWHKTAEHDQHAITFLRSPPAAI